MVESLWKWLQENRPEEAKELEDCFGLQDIFYDDKDCYGCFVCSECCSETLSQYDQMF